MCPLRSPGNQRGWNEPAGFPKERLHSPEKGKVVLCFSLKSKEPDEVEAWGCAGAEVEVRGCAGGRPVFRQACELFVKNAEFTGNGLQSRVLLCYNKLAGGWRVGVPASGHGISPPYRRHTDKTSANGKAEVFCGCFFGRIVIYYKSEGMAFGRLHQESVKLTAERCVGI